MSTMAKDDPLPVDDQSLFFRQIVDSSPALLHTARPDGYLDFFNQTWLDFAGEPLEKLSGWGWTSCIHPENVEAFVRTMRESFAKGEPFQETARLRRADGVYRWMLHQNVPRLDGDGKTIKWHGSCVDIDDRKRAEEQLVKSSEESRWSRFYLAEAQRLGHIGSWVFESSGAFVYWSDELFRIYGLNPEQYAPALDEYLACVHPQDREFMASLIQRMIAEDSGCDVTKRIVLPNAEVRHIRCVGAPVLENGTLKRIIGSAIDVTEHELLTLELSRREAYLAEAQRLSHTGSFGWNPDTGEIVWSAETYRIFEYDCARTPTLDMVVKRAHPQDRALARQVIDQASQTGTDFEHEYRLLLPDGRVKHVHAIAHAKQDASGNREFIGAVTDITERRTAEERVRYSEKELRTLVEAIPTYSGTSLPDGSVDFISQSWLDYTGLSREQGMGWGWGSAVHPEDFDRVVANWRAAVATGTPVEHELRCRRTDGTYNWFLYRGLPLRDDEGNIIKWYGTLTNIDVLKETQSALQMRQHELVGIIETIPSMLWSASPTGETTHLSQRCLEYCGTPLEDLVNRGWENFIHPDDLEETARAFAWAITSGESYRAIHRLRRADGEYRWHHALGEPLRNPQGTIIQWYGLTIDIDEQKRAEETLRRSERELRTLIDVMPVFLGTALPDGWCDFLSESWLDYLGFTKEQGLGWGWANAIHPEDVDRVVANWRAGLAAGEAVEQELRCRRADGAYLWFLNRNLPLRDDEGKVIKWYGVLMNINALKETESALQRREHELLGIIETIPSMLWSTSPTGETTHISQRFLEYYGASFEEVVNHWWERFLHPDDREDTGKAVARAFGSGELYSVIHRLRRADGEYRWHHSMGEPLRASDGKIIQWYGLAIDIDERKRAEDHLRDTRIKLVRASRLATVAELAGSIAHELNQPLMSILANAQAAKRWLHAAPFNATEVNSSIERIIRDARAADETMQHIRALFKQESIDTKDVNIPDKLREVVRVVQEDPKKRGVPIECHFEESLPAIRVDQIQIQQVFINLIVNAIEALDGRQGTPIIVLRAKTESNRMLIQVIDNGPGVDDPDRIFDAFMTTKEKGMGIGLAVSRTIVETHGGRLWAENNEQGGATFTVTLPLSQANLTTA
jgi:PAS domain S-box-containing protein